MFNEFCIHNILIVCFCFTDFVQDEIRKEEMGWVMLFLIVIILLRSFVILLLQLIQFVFLMFIRHQVAAKFYQYVTGPLLQLFKSPQEPLSKPHGWTPPQIAAPVVVSPTGSKPLKKNSINKSKSIKSKKVEAKIN